MMTSARLTSQNIYEIVVESENVPEDDLQDRLAAYDHGFRNDQ